MNITDIEFTPEQAQELIALLQERVDMRERLTEEAEQERLADILATKRYDRVQELARETAAMHGALKGIPVYAQALMTWNVFIDGESWFNPMDVDEYFDPRGDTEYEEGWIFAYTKVLEVA